MCRELKSSLDNYFAFTYGGVTLRIYMIDNASIYYAADSIPMPLIYPITYIAWLQIKYMVLHYKPDWFDVRFR